ncbi:BON domain-containing protein, partial [Rhizobium hidalgonense]
IVLTGTVGTVGEIERATAVAMAVEGVHSVQNRILLGGPAINERH